MLNCLKARELLKKASLRPTKRRIALTEFFSRQTFARFSKTTPLQGDTQRKKSRLPTFVILKITLKKQMLCDEY